ncbi:MAG TPA: D-tyrosyl-tRNA(Tyr) deacylase [Lachnoclostridium phytofermentans]|uniref:D-aminoacyl-tRNA deacylase n=1 Tax=Lachnoclostridium phytofermentans TaxID=66219 RepID=A0A3D2X8L6_9FIRM|nr:D-aminoacyl-tRNA deacylase [Lachnoclostridium sp.]HCL03461.1 D-tyrosyl-tRNA(Tyr) deacylase [Lachnoclostridium phytofermentans]
MKLVIQRVREANVVVDEKVIGKISKGYVVLLGIGKEDTKETANFYINKLLKLRIFEDEQGKTNLSLADVSGELLIISQFTLYADASKGNRPSFINAAAPKEAEELYDYFVMKCKQLGVTVETGRFGADMKVSLVNDGPFTIVLDESIKK